MKPLRRLYSTIAAYFIAIVNSHILGCTERLRKRLAAFCTIEEVNCVLYEQYGEGV